MTNYIRKYAKEGKFLLTVILGTILVVVGALQESAGWVTAGAGLIGLVKFSEGAAGEES